MIYRTGCGHYCKRIFLAERVHPDVMQEITGNLSMLLFGFYALACHDGICLHTMETGRILIGVFYRWRDKGVWENYSICLCKTQISNSSRLTFLISRYIPMEWEAEEEIRTWDAQKGAQYGDTPCCRCLWYACRFDCNQWNSGR